MPEFTNYAEFYKALENYMKQEKLPSLTIFVEADRLRAMRSGEKEIAFDSVPAAALPSGMGPAAAAMMTAKKLVALNQFCVLEAKPSEQNLQLVSISVPNKNIPFDDYLKTDKDVLRKMCDKYIFKKGQAPIIIRFPCDADGALNTGIIPGLVYETSELMDLAPFPLFAGRPRKNSANVMLEKEATLNYIAQLARRVYGLEYKITADIVRYGSDPVLMFQGLAGN